jgi:tRNA threonylcarbamoyladenosine modification (KEOPS) complex  Pcc1 subunit
MVIKNYVHNVIDSIAGDIAVNPPEIQVDSNRDIIFKESANTAIHSVEIVLETHTGQETLVIYDSIGNELLQETAVNRSVKVDLEPGFYKVVVANTDRKKLFEVPADEEVPV